jgi:hypothetical protein
MSSRELALGCYALGDGRRHCRIVKGRIFAVITRSDQHRDAARVRR